jgi:hypothetical protein
MKKINDRIVGTLIKRLMYNCSRYFDSSDYCMYCPYSYEQPCPRDRAEIIEEWWYKRKSK